MQPYPLRFLKNLGRGREIAGVLLNYGFGDVVQRLGLAPYLNWGTKQILRQKKETVEDLTTACRLRLAMQDLGPTFVKFGQVLSTRPDLMPPEFVHEFQQLQERVIPFAQTGVTQLLEREFKRPIHELFQKFDDTPLAAGSLAQVHKATSLDGCRVVVKIRRPNVQQNVERDLSVLTELAFLLEKHVPESKVFDPIGLVKYFSRTIRRELNFQREGRSLQEFARLFENDPRLHVPRFDHSIHSESVLVMEEIGGIKINDIEAMQRLGINPSKIAIDGVSVYLKQAFELGMFHGDPHPGNIRVREDGVIVLLDYGMIGYLDIQRRNMLVDLFVSIARNDVERAVEILKELAQENSSQVESDMLRADVRDFLESYYGLPLSEVKIGQMLSDFLNILAIHRLQCPGDLMLLIRACITLEGVGRTLDPNFNMAELLKPFVEKLMRDRYRPRKLMDQTFKELKLLARSVHSLPIQIGKLVKSANDGDLNVNIEHRGLDKLIGEFDRSSNRIVVGMVISSVILSTALLLRVSGLSVQWVVLPLFLLSGFLGIWLIWGIFRSGRL